MECVLKHDPIFSAHVHDIGQRKIHPFGRFSQKTKQKSIQGPPLARVKSLGDKEVKCLAVKQEISNVSSSLFT